MGAQAAGLDVTPPPPPWSRSCWQEGKGSFTSLRINLLFHSHFLFVLSKIIREKKRGGGGGGNLNLATKPTFHSSWHFLFS